MDRCLCHGRPATWCDGTPTFTPQQRISEFGPLPDIGPDNQPHHGRSYPGGFECDTDCPGWHEGTVVPAPSEGVCAICGDPYLEGEQVAKMPLPAWTLAYAHAVC